MVPRSPGGGFSVRAGRVFCAEQVCCGWQPFAGGVDQEGGTGLGSEGAGPVLVGGPERVQEYLHEGIWPVGLQVVIGARDKVQAVAAAPRLARIADGLAGPGVEPARLIVPLATRMSRPPGTWTGHTLVGPMSAGQASTM